MNTAKKGVQLIAEICRRKGIRKVVFSPGSRSAPLVVAFSQMAEVECMVIPDERVAGYFALGLAQQLKETVAVVCTSGTAVLNLLPAACEASYQEVPLLFLTADRPPNAIYKGENQAIDQEYTFANYALDRNIDTDNDTSGEIIKYTEEAIYHTNQWKQPARLNVHMAEPLYETTDGSIGEIADNLYQPEASKNTTVQRIEAHSKLIGELNATSKKMIVIGLRDSSAAFLEKIEQLAQRNDFVVLTETTSNTVVRGVIDNYDACIELIGDGSARDFVPDVVITLGNQIVSKRIRQFLRKNKPKTHWSIPIYGDSKRCDYFELDNDDCPYIREDEALECLLESEEKGDSEYRSNWRELHQKAEVLTKQYIAQAPYSDLKVYDALVNSLPDKANVQYGNSTPVRYSNFFSHSPQLTINSNRGTSGIDGCVSTAAGAAYATKQPTVLIVGDVSFFYDSNALWNNYLSPNLRIIIINNSGGNIFRLIDGPGKVEGFEKFFETRHNLTAKHLATMYGIPYYFCDELKGLNKILKDFYSPQDNKPAILEIKTDGITSAEVFKGYFEFLRKNR